MATDLTERVQEIADARGKPESEILEQALERGVEDLWIEVVLSRYVNDEIDRETAIDLVGRDRVKRADRELQAVSDDVQWGLDAWVSRSLTRDAGEVSVAIQNTNSPVTGGETLEVTASVESIGADHAMREVNLVVGEDPETMATRTVEVSAGETEEVPLEFETYPVAQDDEFPVRVETDERSAERTVTVFGIKT